MSMGWRIWFALLIVAALYGLVMISDTQEAAKLNESAVESAPQQTVVGLWQLADLATVVIFELIVGVVAVASVGLLLISKDERQLEIEESRRVEVPSHRGSHLRRDPSPDEDGAE